MTTSTAVANDGLFELTRRPSLTQAVPLSFNKLPRNQVVVRWKSLIKFRPSPCQRRAPSQLKKTLCWRGPSRKSWKDKILVFYTWLQPGSSVDSANDNEKASVNEGRRVSSKSPPHSGLTCLSSVKIALWILVTQFDICVNMLHAWCEHSLWLRDVLCLSLSLLVCATNTKWHNNNRPWMSHCVITRPRKLIK